MDFMGTDNNQQQERGGGDLVMLTGLWTNKDKNGQAYLSGSAGMARILIFKIKDPKPDGPTHRLMIGQRQQQEDSGGGSEPVKDSDIPF